MSEDEGAGGGGSEEFVVGQDFGGEARWQGLEGGLEGGRPLSLSLSLTFDFRTRLVAWEEDEDETRGSVSAIEPAVGLHEGWEGGRDGGREGQYALLRDERQKTISSAFLKGGKT